MTTLLQFSRYEIPPTPWISPRMMDQDVSDEFGTFFLRRIASFVCHGLVFYAFERRPHV